MPDPFFIVGCVRSGTTLLRDLLRQHPGLASPEETHIFRWPEPFAGTDFRRIQENNPTLRHHREIDGVEDDRVRELLETATDRREFMDGYMELFLARCGKHGARWFDKTPQHVYGMLLIHALYPDSHFIHIHRHPLNVVASLKEGRAMAPQTAIGAINHWLESILIVDSFRQYRPDLLLDVGYEDLTRNPVPELHRILDFIGEPSDNAAFETGNVYPERNRFRIVLTEEEIQLVTDKLAPYKHGVKSSNV